MLVVFICIPMQQRDNSSSSAALGGLLDIFDKFAVTIHKCGSSV